MFALHQLWAIQQTCGVATLHPVNGLQSIHPLQGSFPESEFHGIIQVWVLCVLNAERKVSSMLAGRTFVHTRGIGGAQVINLHPYKHTTATLLVHSHWVMSPMKQRSVWSGKATHPTGIEWVADNCDTCATGYDVSGLVTRLKRFGTLEARLRLAQV